MERSRIVVWVIWEGLRAWVERWWRSWAAIVVNCSFGGVSVGDVEGVVEDNDDAEDGVRVVEFVLVVEDSSGWWRLDI